MLFSIAVVALASCQKQAADVLLEESVQVSITAVMPGLDMTKAMSHAESVDVVYYEIWNEDWSKRLFPAEGETTVSAPVANKNAVISVTLVKGLTYNMIFWAQNRAFDGYDTSDLTAVDIDYSKFEGNQDRYDAFYAVKTFTVSSVFEEVVYLTRPFAQLNFGASAMSTDLGDIELGSSVVKVSQLATTFDTREGIGCNPIQDVAFVADDIATDQVLEVEDKTFSWVAMNYMLMMNERDVVFVNAEFEILGVDASVKHAVYNVPLEKNYRTTIIGDLFTSNAHLTILVDPAFENPDEVIEIH